MYIVKVDIFKQEKVQPTILTIETVKGKTMFSVGNMSFKDF